MTHLSTIEKEEFISPFRTIQIHVTRKCNLKCLHCYSSSSPEHKDMIDLEKLKQFLVFAYQEGFNNIALSGGEPFLYKDLEELLIFTKQIGFTNTIASNGMLLNSERNKKILNHVDLIAISVDGQEPLHDYIRGQEGAFQKMLQGVKVLKDLNKPFGFIHTITNKSWVQLIWLADFAHTQGAKLLQLHPLELTGRAIEFFDFTEEHELLLHRSFILANYLSSKYYNTMIIQLDLLHKEYLKSYPEAVCTTKRYSRPLNSITELLDNIVVDEHGNILPISYGFHPRYQIGNIHNFQKNIFSDYLKDKSKDFENLFNMALDNIYSDTEKDIINWNEILLHTA